MDSFGETVCLRDMALVDGVVTHSTPTESFDASLMDLMIKARTWNFGVLDDSVIFDQIVFGYQEKSTRKIAVRDRDAS